MRLLSLLAGLALVVVLAAVAVAEDSTVRDRKRETKALERKPELDIVRAVAREIGSDRLAHRVRMRGRLKPGKRNTRPFILINTRGGKRSDYEFIVAGRRVLEVVGDRFRRVGSNLIATSGRTWVYRFDRASFDPGDAYGWAALTAKGSASDVAPDRRYKQHRLSR